MSSLLPSGAGIAYTLATPRLRLVCADPSFAPKIKLAVDSSLESLREWMSWTDAHPMALDGVIDLFRNFRAMFDRGEQYPFLILDGAGVEVLGAAGLHPRIGPGGLEIGYWVRADRRNEGIATETSAALTRIGFELFAMDRVEIRVAVGNHSSNAVPAKLGFTHEATLRRRIPLRGERIDDACIWTMFASEFPTSPAAKVAVEARDVAGRRLL